MKKQLSSAILASFLAIGISTNAMANTVKGVTVSKTHVHTSSGLYFSTNETMKNPENCSGDSDAPGFYVLRQGDYTKEAFSVLLAAHMSNKKINIHLQGCNGIYPIVDWVQVYDA